jgi:uncharacterized membrane protein YeaQ/YmgE (transglycosylase-associated protein family)
MWNIITFICFGVFIGVVARLLKPGKQNLGWLGTIVLGVVGALIGGIVATLIGTGSLNDMDFIGGAVAVVAAVLLVGVAEAFFPKKQV